MRTLTSSYTLESVRKQRTYTKEDLFKTQILFRTLFLVALVAILSLFYIWSRVQIVHYGYEINRLRSNQDTLLEQNKKLKVEWATLKSPQRIEKIAAEKLMMQAPMEDQIRPLR
ncbi:MAG: Cell division protein FtsL [uncultured bacterium]|nr:MAG: Cell division protein FtsL [uncultured bacterium]